MRVPGIAWWPGRIPAGSVQREMAVTLDLLPTFAKLSGSPPPQGTIDGMDITPLLFGTGKVERGAFLYYRGTTLFAARLGQWKAHFITRSGYGTDQPIPHDPPLLFHLGEDPGERWSRAGEHPEVLARIREAIDAHRATLQPAAMQLEETIPEAR